MLIDDGVIEDIHNLTNITSSKIRNEGIKLSHHEKRAVARKLVICVFIFFFTLLAYGILHYFLNITDPNIDIFFIILSFTSITMFGTGYLIRDRLPKRMNAPCKRFSYLGNEFGIWHWDRAKIFLADIFLVALTGGLFGWSIFNTIVNYLGGTSYGDFVPLLYIPVIYVYFWFEILVEIVLLIITVVATIYELRVWILGRTGDLCYFEMFKDHSPSLYMNCDPRDPNCDLNDVNLYKL